MRKRSILDLAELPDGGSYSDRYRGWLDVFRMASEESGLLFRNVPKSWVPLLLYLGNDIDGIRDEFVEDRLVEDPEAHYRKATCLSREREYVESICSFRPELADALWKSDCQWHTQGRRHKPRHEFVVANYLSFYRPEVLEYFTRLEEYMETGPPPGIDCCVVTSCSAEKPYPAMLHAKIRSILPDSSWHLVIATGVLGVVPEELWSCMPLYDAGIANQWRCQVAWERYLSRVGYRRIVIYTEFNANCVFRAASSVVIDGLVECVLPVGGQDDFLDLADDRYLNRLRETIEREPFRATAKFLL